MDAGLPGVKRPRLSLNVIVLVVTALGLAGAVWLLIDVVRGEEPSALALWMMMPLWTIGLALNVALGCLLAWKKLRSQKRGDGDSG